MREGTDYTHRDITIEEKNEQVLKQIKKVMRCIVLHLMLKQRVLHFVQE